MARGSYLWDEDAQTWAPKHEVLRRRAIARAANRSSLPTPAVIGAMPEIQSMADGQFYSDKRSYEKSLARHGCEVVGFDKNWTDHVEAARRYDEKAHEADIVADIKRATEEVSSRT